MPQVEVMIRGADAGVLLQVSLGVGEYVLGRAPEVELSFEAESVSRRHARLVVGEDRLLVEDLGSSNGTFLDGKAVTGPTPWRPHQRLQVGAATVELRVPGAAGASDGGAVLLKAIRNQLPESILRERKYEVGDEVAQGGMGVVRAAEERPLGRTVAVKMMLEAATPDAVEDFIREARITGQLEHPSIVPVHELGVDAGGQVFYTMKFVHGITLHRVLEALSRGHPAALKDFPLGNLLTVFQKVCDALAFAHSKEILHCDLKPANIMLGEFGEVLVMDWGLARPIRHHKPGEQLRRSGQRGTEAVVMGTPQYMSPEQARGELDTLDARSDIYALGAILYEMLAFRPSVQGNDPDQLAGRVAAGRIDPLREPELTSQGKAVHRPIPESLAAVVRKAMALERTKRYAGVAELQADVRAFQNGFATTAEKAGLLRQAKLFVGRHKAAAAAVAAVVVAVGWLGGQALVEGRRAEQALVELKRQAPALRRFADIEAEAGNFQVAIDHLDGAAKLDPGNLAGEWRRVWLLVGLEQYQAAKEALDRVSERDPANVATLAAPVHRALAEMAAATTDVERYRADRLAVLFNHLGAVGAKGEALAISRRIKLSTDQKRDIVARAVRERMGLDPPPVITTPTGFLQLSLNGKRVPSLEPLRGLPIDLLEAGYTYVSSLDGLQGMPLMKLVVNSNQELSDLSPLRGMTLTELNVSSTKVSDLTPLAGMPLRVLNISNTPVIDLGTLSGLPLIELRASGIRAADCSLPRALPLRILDFRYTAASNCETFAVPTLEQLYLGNTRIADLEPLAGMTPKLGVLEIENCQAVRNFAPLLRLAALKRLATSAPIELLVPLKNHPSLEAINYRNAGYLPAARFWAEHP